jgi:hypothetical protein
MPKTTFKHPYSLTCPNNIQTPIQLNKTTFKHPYSLTCPNNIQTPIQLNKTTSKHPHNLTFPQLHYNPHNLPRPPASNLPLPTQLCHNNLHSVFTMSVFLRTINNILIWFSRRDVMYVLEKYVLSGLEYGQSCTVLIGHVRMFNGVL